MRLLIITQKVDQNDAILGFFHEWLIKFAARFDTIEVICLEEGQHELPANVRVHSLGKERRRSRSSYIYNFFRYIWSLRNKYDAIFVHMNPIYVILGGWLWKISGKRVDLWYVHRSVDFKLRLASWFVDTIYTAAKESCLLKSRKIEVVGHGIDTEKYSSVERSLRLPDDPIRIIHVGRITRIKNCDTLVAAAEVLKRTWGKSFEILFIGEPVTDEDISYKKSLDSRIVSMGLSDIIDFIGPVPNREMVAHYAQADASINLTPTGGTDKAVLESLASGVPAFFSNEAFVEVVTPYESVFRFSYRDADMLAQKIKQYFNRTDNDHVEQELRTKIRERFSIMELISRISLNIHDTSR